jgi:hypothetical protein
MKVLTAPHKGVVDFFDLVLYLFLDLSSTETSSQDSGHLFGRLCLRTKANLDKSKICQNYSLNVLLYKFFNVLLSSFS